MCVSTAIVGSPKIVFRTTFAVLRPTPGQCFERLARARHLTAMNVGNRRRRRDHVLRLRVPQADGADVFRQVPRRRARRWRAECSPRGTTYGLPHSRSCRWPARTGSPPTSSSNGVWYSSSVVGCGFAARKRSKIWRRLLGFMVARPARRASSFGQDRGALARRAARCARRVPRVARGWPAAARQREHRCAALRKQRDHARCNRPGRARCTTRSPCRVRR